MMQNIVQDQYFEIAIDTTINRLYLKLIGFWPSAEAVAHYVPALEKALSNVRSGYTLLTDLREMKTHPAELKQIHIEAQDLLIKKGLLQTAEIVSSSFVEFQTDAISKNTNMPLKQFQNEEDAVAFLNESGNEVR